MSILFHKSTWAELQDQLEEVRRQLTELDIASQGEFDLTPEQQFAYDALGQTQDAILDGIEEYKQLNN